LLPEDAPRYEEVIRPAFEEKVKALCEDCRILYSNAEEDVERMIGQGEAALRKGVDVLVIDQGGEADFMGPVVEKAKAKDVPVLAYDHVISESEPDVFVSYDDTRTGELQVEALVERLKADGNPRGPILVILGENGARYQHLFEDGVDKALTAAKLDVPYREHVAYWEAIQARETMEEGMAKAGKDGFVGVYAETDSLAEGVIGAMRGAGIDPAARPTTGREATLAGLQRILAGQQYMTVYRPREPEAVRAAEVAVELGEEGEISEDEVTDTVDNFMVEMPSVLLDGVVVTKGNIERTVIADGFVTPAELCAGAYARACRAAGISG
jgi:D-xylose transport system substrate-binding protein